MARKPPTLLPMGAAPLKLGEGVEAAQAARIRDLWPFVVGPVLARRTCLLRLHKGRLLMGCWDLKLVPSLRQAADTAWPDLRDRVARVLGIRLRGLDVVPCDPPAAEAASQAAPPRPEDPLKAALERLKAAAEARRARGLPDFRS